MEKYIERLYGAVDGEIGAYFLIFI
jgi:hypothetical protein